MIRWKRPGPLVQMTLALVTMTISILVLADLLMGMSSHSEQQMQHAARKRLSESLAVQTAVLMRGDDAAALNRFLGDMVLRLPELRSAAVRRADGRVMASAGPHQDAWVRGDEAHSTPENVRVPMAANGQTWGDVELAFHADGRSWWAKLLASTLARQILFVGLVGAFGYALYMRRALQHLDPSAVIPERVQRAFDAMAEGVVVLDARGRVMLANRSFRALSLDDSQIAVGQALSSISWLAAALPADLARHPWMRSMSERQPTADDHIVIAAGARPSALTGTPVERRLVVSCAPISDKGGAVRGCMATFNDMTELHRTNAALQKAMREVEAGKQELHLKNAELERLATQDVLSSCLNRRAFMDRASPLVEQACARAAALGCLMLDIDHFKSVNDTHGHGVGDRVITEVARILRESAPAGALVGRYGGEEFCIVAPGLDLEGVAELGDAIRLQVQQHAGKRVEEVPDMQVTISVGASRCFDAEDSLAALIDRADQALYRAKRGGRNRVTMFTTGAPADAAAPA